MAWAKEIDAARTHLATVLAEFSRGMDARVRAGGPGIADHERAYKDFLTGTIIDMSNVMFQSPGVELSVLLPSLLEKEVPSHED